MTGEIKARSIIRKQSRLTADAAKLADAFYDGEIDKDEAIDQVVRIKDRYRRLQRERMRVDRSVDPALTGCSADEREEAIFRSDSEVRRAFNISCEIGQVAAVLVAECFNSTSAIERSKVRKAILKRVKATVVDMKTNGI